MSTYYKECFIEKIYHFDNEVVLDKVKLYSVLYLIVDGEEPFRDQVKIIYVPDEENDNENLKQGEENQEENSGNGDNKKNVIGVLSKEDGKLLFDIVKNGWTNVFKAVVVKIDKDGGEDKTYKIVIKIERKDIEENRKCVIKIDVKTIK